MSTAATSSFIKHTFFLSIAIWIISTNIATTLSDDPEQLASQIKAHEAAGRYREAITVAERRGRLIEKRSGSNSAEAAQALQQWSDLLADQNRHEDALPIVRRVLELREKTLGENHRDTAY